MQFVNHLIHFIFLNDYVHNQRERQRNAQLIVSVEGNTTVLYNPNNPEDEPKSFTYDHSYWSHDGFTEADNGLCIADAYHINGRKYVDQVLIHNLSHFIALLC